MFNFRTVRSLLLTLAYTSTSVYCSAQVGPKDPTVGSNNAGTGSNAWVTPGNVLYSDNAFATSATKGLTNYVWATGFGFAIPNPSLILGVQLDVEKHTFNPQNVALLNGWTTGLTKTVSAGTDRCLIVVTSMENGTTTRDITALTYGGRSMTLAAERVEGGGASFSGQVQIWMLLEAQLILASGTAIVPTYGSATQIEYCEAFSSAVFQFVDQLAPVADFQTSGAIASTNPHQLGTTLLTRDGSMAVNAVLCGNNTSPASTAPATNTYTINSGYTEGTDLYFANPGFAATGACLQTAHKAITTAGTEQPACTFAGPVNRWLMVAITLRRAREIDYDVRLVKAGGIGGSNMAVTPAWGTTKSYTSYGGPTSLWGLTLNVADVNAVNFGAAFSARVQNGTARVDHMRITVYAMSTLPIELLDFQATPAGDMVQLDWATATETNNDHFIVQRSNDGFTFEDLDRIEGAGNSLSLLTYRITDPDPLSGTSFYRLKQVDVDGTSTDSPTRVVTMAKGEFVVYPNPTPDGRLNLLGALPGSGEVAVYSADLRWIRTVQLSADRDPVIHIEDLDDGTYVLLIGSGAAITTTRVIKASSRR